MRLTCRAHKSETVAFLEALHERQAMYIRWKEKPRAPRWDYDEHHVWRRGVRHETRLLVAYLVESQRVNGKPRQKARYLACIQERYLGVLTHQAHFWEHALARLEEIPLSAQHRPSLEAALATRVPRPSAEAIAKNRVDREALLQSWASKTQKTE
jgi:hypothetical protein